MLYSTQGKGEHIMAMYYYKLWKILEERGINRATLLSGAGITETPYKKMQHNESVSVETLDRICTYLNCDFGDILTNVPEDNTYVPLTEINHKANDVLRSLLKTHMDKYNMNVNQISNITSVSINTLKSFLNGKPISHKTCQKFFTLGKEFENALVQCITEKEQDTKKKTYCTACDSNLKKCYALVLRRNGDSIDPICLLDKELQIENKSIFTYSDCPRPSSIRECQKAASAIGKKV